jgi:deazaflavin-dependent oxidoreductase (nitroreductase family)
MTTLTAPAANRLRRAFKAFNHCMLLVWRLGLGGAMNAWPSVGGRICVLTHTGRKTGRRRRTPLNYAVIGEEIYCVAGFGAGADWYRNVQRDPRVEVWLPDGWWEAVAVEVTDPQARLPALRAVLVASGLAAPLAGVDPRRLDDDALQAAAADYRVIRLRRRTARTGPGGPGDLAWVWPWLTALLALRLMRRRR